MCALIMSNGHMNSISDLRGNTFPLWRYGGIRPENTITPLAANAFFLEIDTRDAETMTDTAGIRQAVADSRQMQPFDAALGDRRPAWLHIGLNQELLLEPFVPIQFHSNMPITEILGCFEYD